MACEDCFCSAGSWSVSAGARASRTVPPPRRRRRREQRRSRFRAMPKIEPQPILEHIKVLASDEFEGRAPGTKGEELTRQVHRGPVQEARAQARQSPTAPTSRRCRSSASPRSAGQAADDHRRERRSRRSSGRDEVVAWTKHVADTRVDRQLRRRSSPATASRRRSSTGTTSRASTSRARRSSSSSTIPAVPDPADPAKLDPKTFGGDAMTYYGRWTYKFEEGARKGAAGDPHRPRNRAGRLSVLGRPGQPAARSSTS